MKNNIEKPLHLELNSNNLQLSLTNPRFLNEVSNEKEAILEMLRLKKVGPKKIKNLITDIFDTDFILEDFVVLKKDDTYIVYDGNRRLTAMKLFKDENLLEIKNEFKDLYAHIVNIKKSKNLSNMIVSAKIYTDKTSIVNHVSKIHSGEQDGIGQIPWGKPEKDNFENQNSNNKPSFSNMLLTKLSSDKTKEKLYDEIVEKTISTTIDRIFAFSAIKTRIFGLKRGEDILLDDTNTFNKVCEMIEFFLNKNGKVSDVYLKDDATSYFININPVNEYDQTTNDENVETEIDLENDSGEKIIDEKDEAVDENIINNDRNKYQITFELTKKYQKIRQYQDVDLTNLIKVASDNNGEDLSGNVEFFLNEKLLSENIFSGNTPSGKYNIQVKLENNNIVKSHSVILDVEEVKRRLNPVKKERNDLFVPISSLVKGDVSLDISDTVNNIIYEIQSINEPEKYPLMIASSVRQLLERSIDLLIVEKSLGYKKADTDSMISILNDIKNNKSLLGKLVNGENKMSYQETHNLITSINTDALVRYLHLITHNSDHTFYNDLRETINKKITPYLILIHNYLKLPK